MWVVDEWAPWIDEEFEGQKAEPGELRWYLYADGDIKWFSRDELQEDESGLYVELGGERRRPASRTFIQAFLEDNPHLGTDYEKRLDALPDELRSAYKSGDFTVRSSADPFQVIPASWVRAAQGRHSEASARQSTHLGVDPARGGKDRTVIAIRGGSVLTAIQTQPGKETPDGQSVATAVRDVYEPGTDVIVDVIGVGSSVVDVLKEHMEIGAFNGSASTSMTDRSGSFALRNKRSAAYWHLRELLDPSTDDEIALPPGRELREELCAPRYKVLTSGIAVESKEEIKKRLGRSPDLADAVVYAFADVLISSSETEVVTL
jgi:hypothetical protein